MAIYKPELPMETIERLNGELEIKQKYLTDAYDAIDRLQDELRDKMAIDSLCPLRWNYAPYVWGWY